MVEARGYRSSVHSLALLLALTVVLSALGPGAASAHSTMSSRDGWIDLDGNYLKRFPAEIRRAIEQQKQACGPLASVDQHFVRYIHESGSVREYIALHFDHFRCGDRSRIWGPDGCLHEVYAPSGTGYRRIFSGRVGEVTMKIIDRAPAVEVDCETSASAPCPRFVWPRDHRIEPARGR
jgi:hypothetical protein